MHTRATQQNVNSADMIRCITVAQLRGRTACVSKSKHHFQRKIVLRLGVPIEDTVRVLAGNIKQFLTIRIWYNFLYYLARNVHMANASQKCEPTDIDPHTLEAIYLADIEAIRHARGRNSVSLLVVVRPQGRALPVLNEVRCGGRKESN